MSSHPTRVRSSFSLAERNAWSWIKSQQPFWLDYTIIFLVFAVVYVSVLYTRAQFVPDSQYYLGMAFWFSGMSQEDAHAAVRTLGFANGPDVQLMFGWGLVQPRVVLPALATPLVLLFGAKGLTITTGIITIILLVVLYSFLSRRFGRLPALSTLVLTMSSVYIMWFSTAMLTESLSALWGALLLIAAYRYQRTRSVWWVVAMVVITTLSAFTRQATFIAAGAFVIAWLVSLFFKSERHKWSVPALAVAGTALLMQVLQTLIFPTFSQADQFMKQTGTSSLGEALLATPLFAARLLVRELTNLAHSDPVVLVLITLSILSMILFWRRPESHLLLGAILGVALYNITNGTPTSFRYAIPGLVFYLASTALLMSEVNRRLSPGLRMQSHGTPSSALPQNSTPR